jgi:replicative DNA helicase
MNQTLQPPHSPEAEEAVLGAIFIEPELFHRCCVILDAGEKEFFIIRNQWLWTAFSRLINAGKPVDLVTVTDELDDMGRLEEFGGPARIVLLMNASPHISNVEAYADIVHEKYIRRKMLETANAIANGAYDDSISLMDFSSQAAASLNANIRLIDNNTMVDIADAVRAADERNTRRAEEAKKGILPGIPSGLIDLDKKLGGGGFQQEALYEIVCRPGGGKTSFLLQVAQNAARHAVGVNVIRKHVAFFEMEMSKIQIVNRMISQRTGIDSQLLDVGAIPESKLADYYEALDNISNLDMFIDDRSGISPAYIRSRCEILASQRKLDMILVDYLALMKSGMRFSKTSEEVDFLARELKGIARDFKIPVLVAAQMNRSIEKRDRKSKPVMSDLNEGGEKDADAIIFIHHELDDNDKPTGMAELVIAKHRNGPLGDIPVIFRQNVTRFESAAKVRL